jgi:autotransporter-associated beta strand protein
MANAGRLLPASARMIGAIAGMRVAMVLGLALATLSAATVTWTGGSATTNNWTDAANWGGTAPVAGDDLRFAGSTRLTPFNDFAANTSFNSITFNAGAGDFFLTGNAITVTGGATAITSNATSGTMTINLALTFSTAAPTIASTAGGSLVFGGTIANGGLLVTMQAAGPISSSAAITGTGGMTKTGSSTLTLTGLSAVSASNYSGTTTLDGGTLVVTTTNPVLSGALVFGVSAGSANVSALDLSAASLTTGALTVRTNSASANTVTIGNTRTYTTSGNVTIGTAVSATTTRLTMSGAGTWNVNAAAGAFWLGGFNPVVANNTNSATLDLSGLAIFTCDLTTGSMLLGRFGDNNTRSGSMTLAATSTIKAATLTVGESASGSVVTLNLGSTSATVWVDTLNIGTGGRDSGVVQFAGASGTLSLRNRAGSGRANVNVQTGGAGTGYAATNGLLLSGHSCDLQINALVVGGQPRSGAVTNTITFDTGTLDATTVRLGERSGTTVTPQTHTSTLTIGGGTVIIGTGGLQMATNTATGATANALTATTTISGGTVTIANNAAIGGAVRLAHNTAASGGTTANATLSLTGGTLTPAGAVIRGTSTMPTSATLTLAGGTLAMGGSTIGSGTALVTGNWQSGTVSNLAEFNGGGTFTKSSNGTLTLAGTHACTGPTSVSAGMLLITGSTAAANTITVASVASLGGTGTIAGSLVVASGASVAPGLGGSTIGTLTTTGITWDPGGVWQVNLDGTGPTADVITSAGTVSVGGVLSVGSLTNGAPGRVYTIASGAAISGTFTGVADGTSITGDGRTLRVNYLPTSVTLTELSSTWDGGGGDDNWSTAANWSGDVVPSAGADLVFAGTTRLTPVNDLPAGTSFNSISFASGAGNFVLTGNNVSLAGGSLALTNAAASGTMTITMPLTFTVAPQIAGVAGSTLVLNGTIDSAGFTVTHGGSGALVLSGDLTGSGSLAKNGSGQLTASGASTYSGGTLLTQGDLVVASNGGVGSGPLGTGTVSVNPGANFARLQLGGGHTVSNALVMTTSNPDIGRGSLEYTGFNVATWSGPITINADATSGGHFRGGGTWNDYLLISGPVTTGGAVTAVVSRALNVQFSNPGNSWPQLRISGAVRMGAAGVLPPTATIFMAHSGSSGDGGTLDLNNFDQTTAGITFTNPAGGIITTGTGTLTLNGDFNSTFTGALDANVNSISGKLDLGGATRTFTVADNSAANDVTISAVISNGALTKAGTGTLAFTGTAANTYTGTTTVSAGTLQLAKTAGVNAVAGDLAVSGGRVTFGANHQIADTATVTMSGSTSVFNGTAANVGTLADLNETIAALTVTGGAFNCGTTGSTPVIAVTGAAAFTGGAGNTIFIAQSGTTFTAGSLSITSMTATAGGTVGTANSFTVYGNSTTVWSTLRIGSLTLAGGRINLRRGGAGALGSRVILDGDVTTSTAASFISEDTNGGTTGTLAVELSSTVGAVVRTLTLGTNGALDINVPITNGASVSGGLLKTGVQQLNLGGGTLANTYTGVTTVPQGCLNLTKGANTIAVPGDLQITGGQVRMASSASSNQIADGASVTMSGTTSVFNGTAGVNVNVANVTETIGSLVITGGNFNFGGTSVWTITGAFSVTGGGNTIVVGNSGSRLSAGSLGMNAMTARAGGTVATNNSFTLYGASSTQQTILTVGAGGLTLDNSTLHLRFGGTAGNLGSKLVLNGDVTTTGIAATGIAIDTAGGTNGAVTMDLSSTAGAVTRTITTPGGGADLTIGVPIVDGAATPGALTKQGAGALTVSGVNTYTGATTVNAGTLYVTGSTVSASAVSVASGATLGGNGTIAGTIAMNGGTFAPGSGGTTIGQLATGAITWDPATTYAVDLTGTGPTSDRITTAGQPLAIGGTLSVASLVNGSVGQVFTILSASAISGTFTGLAEGAIIPVSGRSVRLNYLPTSVTLTVHPPPSVTAITPNFGQLTDTQAVVITGTDFMSGATVTIGGNPATSVVWVSATRIDAVTPTGVQGPADVVVTNTDGQSGTLTGGYRYQGAVPTISSITPANGPALTTTAVTITGTNFFASNLVAVSVGGVAATAVTYVDANTITANFPAMATTSTDATPDVVVTSGDAQQVTLANGFSYDLRPVDSAPGAIAGLAYRYHRSGGPLLPDFTTRVPALYGVRANATINGANPLEARNDNWSMEFGGYVTVPVDGIYTFYTASDDGSRLYIGTTLVVSNNFAQGVTERSGQIALSAGTHRVRIEFAQGGGGYGLFVRWLGPTITKQDIPDLSFSCDPAPQVTGVSPASGPQGGGTALTITGSGFVAGSIVVIDGQLGVTPVVLDDSTITVTTAGGTTGVKDILVIGPRSTGAVLSTAFTYLTSAAPTLTAITPSSGSAPGGTTVRLTVSNVDVTPTVTFNGVAATSVVRLDATTVECVTPAMPATDATADVVVTVGGQSATLSNGFTWQLRAAENPTGTQANLAYRYYQSGGPTLPTFSALTPFSTGLLATPTFTVNPVEGAARTTNFSLIYRGYLTVPVDGVYTLYTASDDGSRLSIGTTVVVDNNFAQGTTERSGLIGLSAGTHLITVEFAQGTGGFAMYTRWSYSGQAKIDIPASAFTTDPTPSIGSLDVVNGPQTGGTTVTISGSGFVSGAAVAFGGTAASNVVVGGGGTTITCTTPSHAVGLVAVVVTNPTGTNATLAGAFTYDAASGPTITSITPASGSADGGTAVTIMGSNFVAPMTVTIGGQAVTNLVVSGDGSSMTALTPGMNSNSVTVDVVVTNGASQSATLVGGYTYLLRTPENPTNTQAGLTYRYHRVAGPSVPNFTGLTPYRIGVTNSLIIPTGNPGVANPFDAGYNTNWSVELLGYITVPADDVYTFYTQADDSTQVFIGNARVVNNTVANVESAGGSIGLAAGTHRITVRLAQGGGSFALNVRWQSTLITKASIPDNVLTTDATPTVTAVSPAAGTASGGTAITITGSGFTSGTTVSLGGTLATSVVVASDGQSLTALTPAHAIGNVAATITNGNGLSVTQNNAYLFQGSAPVITAVSPQVGPTTGGTTVLIYGSNFTSGLTVRVNGVLATAVSLNAGIITATTPAGTQGPAVVTVTNVDGTVGTRSPGFYYQGPAPTITTISPAQGPLAGGTAVTITGTNLVAGVRVTFDGVDATGITLVGNTITCTSPAGVQGPADVVVTNVDLRTATRSGGFVFEGPVPTITSIVPASGLLAGGTNITINGTNFAAGATVQFDGVLATGVTVTSTSITCTTPAGAQGPADVVVTNVDYLAATSTAGFIYLGAAPTIGGVTPTTVPNNLSTPITITGTNFVAGVAVTIGGVSATISSWNATTIVVPMPAGVSPGPVNLVVTNVDLQTATFGGFIAQGPAPIIRGFDVPYGPVAGGRRLTIVGSAFRAGATVTFGGVPATSVTVVDAGTIVAVSPAHPEGKVTITVTNDDLLAASVADAYAYYKPSDTSVAGNGCGTGGGLAVFMLLALSWFTVGNGGRRR